jgi:hypothetical protein
MTTYTALHAETITPSQKLHAPQNDPKHARPLHAIPSPLVRSYMDTYTTYTHLVVHGGGGVFITPPPGTRQPKINNRRNHDRDTRQLATSTTRPMHSLWQPHPNPRTQLDPPRTTIWYTTTLPRHQPMHRMRRTTRPTRPTNPLRRSTHRRKAAAMTKQEWRTLSIRINPQRKAIALQGRFPITLDEWDLFMSKLETLKPQLTQDRNP